MAFNSNVCTVLFPILLASLLLNAHAGDPDLTTDFLVPDGAESPKFVFRGLRDALKGMSVDEPFKVKKASQAEFPVLMGQGVSYASLWFAPNGTNGLHTHPRAAELMLVLQGWLEVGFIDGGNKLVTQVIGAGDLFVFPKGMVHYQVNRDAKYSAHAISAFGSASPGTVVLQKALFESGVETEVLAKSFKTDVDTINMLV